MKKIKIIAFIFLGIAMSASAQDASHQKRMQELVKQRVTLIAGAPLSAHWTHVQSKLMELLEIVSQQLNSQSIIIKFDERAFGVLVNDVLIKLAMPSVTDDEREELSRSIAFYLHEKGPLKRVAAVLHINKDQDLQNARDAIAYIIEQLQRIEKRVEETRKEK